MGQEEEAQALAHANWLFAQQCDFIAGAMVESAIPMLTLPEVAFAGRSNVGKSSLVNALTGRRTLARVSHTPGRTRQLNFFSLGERLLLVDLPGYGYAKASKSMVAGWSRLIVNYLKGRRNLARVCVLIDSRRGPKETDEQLMVLLDECAVNYQLVLTKADKTTKAEREAMVQAVLEKAGKHTAMHPEIIVTSSRDNVGIEALRMELARFTV